MKIGGFQRTTLIDFPGKIASIVFTNGCNFRCPYCHNPELSVRPEEVENISESAIFEYLITRKGKIDGVVITGGEPTLQPGLLAFMRRIKAMGFLVKLDSNGTNPEILEKAVEEKLVDYIAMDIKAPLDKYEKIAKSKVNLDKIQKSIDFIMNSGIDYEFRTTIVENLLSKEDICEIGEKTIKGAKKYYLQNFIPTKAADPECLKDKSYTQPEMIAMSQDLKQFVGECDVR
ncbi:MAG: anaerobic ribonucleoside-triphosphate reductase activating protein [bacterium]